MTNDKYIVTAPKTPGATPSTVGSATNLRDARRIATTFSRGRHDLAGQDVRIELTDGKLVEYAGVGR